MILKKQDKNKKIFRFRNRSLLFMIIVIAVIFESSGVSAKSILLTYKDGLPGNRISSIFKDSRGLIWIGTDNGLCYYDGYRFSRIPGELGSATITCLKSIPRDSILWVGTDRGLYTMNLLTMKTGSLVYHQTKGNKERIFPDYVSAVGFGNQNEVLTVFKNGVIEQLDKGKGFRGINSLDLGYISDCSFHKLPDGDFLLFVNFEPYKLDIKTNSIAPFKELIRRRRGIYSIQQSDDHRLVIGTFNHGVYLWDIMTNRIYDPPVLHPFNRNGPGEIMGAIFRNNRFFIATKDYGFYVVDSKSGRIDTLSLKDENIFRGKKFQCFLVDDQGVIWQGTNKGLIRTTSPEYLFDCFLDDEPGNISTRNIVQRADKDIYVASYSGLYEFDNKNQKWTNYVKFEPSGSHEDENMPHDIFPYGLLIDASDHFLYAGLGGNNNILKFDFQRKKFINIPLQQTENVVSNGIWSFCPIGRKIWVGTDRGLGTFYPDNQKFVLHLNDSFSLEKRASVYTVQYSPARKKLLICSSKGFYVMNPENGYRQRFSTNTVPALSNEDVFNCYEDEDGYIWLSTNGGGLNRLSPDFKTINYYTIQNGLSSNIVYDIQPGGKKALWISTLNGLNRFDKEDETFLRYFKDQGLPTDEFNKNSSMKGIGGKLYFGTINGVVSFYPERLESLLPPPFQIFLSGISYWDAESKSIKDLPADASLNEGKIRLTKQEANYFFELHFGISDYTDTRGNSFLYRIKELNNKWVSLNNNNTFSVNSLPYGRFTLEVKALNYRGVLSNNTLSIQLDIIKPFYQEWWFYLLLTVLVAGAFYVVFSLKLIRLESAAILRMKISSSLHDGVGSTLTRIAMLAEGLRYNIHSKNKESTLDKIADLSREAIASMGDVLWAIDSRNDFAGNLSDRMKEHAEGMLYPLEFELEFDFSEMNQKMPVASNLRKELFLIFKEAVHNIAKYGVSGTKVLIRLKINHEGFDLKVANLINQQLLSGGRKPSGSLGLGLRSMQQRAQVIGAHCEIKQESDLFTIHVSK